MKAEGVGTHTHSQTRTHNPPPPFTHTPPKVMAEVNAGMKEALPQLNAILSKRIKFGKRYITPV